MMAALFFYGIAIPCGTVRTTKIFPVGMGVRLKL